MAILESGGEYARRDQDGMFVRSPFGMNYSNKNKRNSFLKIRDAFKDADNAALINGVNALKKAVATYLG